MCWTVVDWRTRCTSIDYLVEHSRRCYVGTLYSGLLGIGLVANSVYRVDIDTDRAVLIGIDMG
jgi:hypothetical protein